MKLHIANAAVIANASHQGYVAELIPESGELDRAVIEFRSGNGQLDGTVGTADPTEGSSRIGLAFYRPDYGLDLGPDGKAIGTRSNFVRDAIGNIIWFRSHGRLFRRQ